MRRYVVLLSLASLLGAAACSPNEEDTHSEDSSSDAAGADRPETGDTSPDGDAPSRDADVEPDCRHQTDCPEQAVCIDGTCRDAPSCNGPSNWASCVRKLEELQSGLGKRAYCDGSTCRVGCLFDNHCPKGDVCTDNGLCRHFEGELSADHPGGEDRGPLRVGFGQRLLEFPIGLSLGGFGSRTSSGSGRYVESLRASHGQLHGLYARALAFDNGARELLFVRLPIIFATDALHEAVARRLQEETGRNWRDSLLISATHTHSGPARFYHLPRETLIPVGGFGTDEFHDRVFQWLVDSTYRAASRALEQRADAAFGTKIVESFDVDDVISSDRWSETPPFDDNRLLVMRIDDPSGVPRAVGVSLGTHGTVHSEDYFTGDALSGLERGLEEALAREFDRYVPVLFFNQNGGTMSPRGDQLGHRGPQRLEKIGRDFADKAVDELLDVETSRTLELDGATHRFPITYDLLGYEDDEWGESHFETVRRNYQYGGLRCGAGEGDDDPNTHIDPAELECQPPIHQLLFHRPPTLFLRSQMSAFELGDLTLVTAPGELSMELSWQIIRQLEGDHDLDPLRTWTLGFAQDHQFYLLPTDLRGDAPPFPGYRGPEPPGAFPERAFSYLQGGYEASLSLWGWKFGDYLVERASETVGRLDDEETGRDLPKVLPTQFSPYGHDEFPVSNSDPDRVGSALEEPPEVVERFEAIEFAWIGGDPGAEMPQSPRVVLERETDEGFQTLQTSRRRPYTNREPVMVTRLRKEDNSWVWVVRWEELRNFPTGTYRFAVEGSYASDADRESYTTQSREFQLRPSNDLALTASANDEQVKGTISYPPAETFRYEGTSDDPGRVRGNYRLRGADVPAGVGPPPAAERELTADDIQVLFQRDGSVVATHTGSQIELRSTKRSRDGADAVPTTTFSTSTAGLASGEYRITVRARDSYENTGETTFSHMLSN